MIKFDQVWSSLIKFDPIWSNLNQFYLVLTKLSIWSNLKQFYLIWNFKSEAKQQQTWQMTRSLSKQALLKLKKSNQNSSNFTTVLVRIFMNKSLLYTIHNLEFRIIQSEPHVVLKFWSKMILEPQFKWPAILNLNYVMDQSLTYFLCSYVDRSGQTDRQSWFWNQSIWISCCSEILNKNDFRIIV